MRLHKRLGTNVRLDLSSYQTVEHGARFAKTKTIRVNKDDRFPYAPAIARDMLDSLPTVWNKFSLRKFP